MSICKSDTVIKNFEDCYNRVVHNYEDLLNEVKINEETTEWMPGIISKNIKLSAFTPIEAYGLAEETDIPFEVLIDTGDNTELMLEYGGKKYCVRDTAKNTMLETAKIPIC